ncbi:quinon protein alcohol dehydrogenase-like superfamily [Dactylonectria estremocensis]|uniref:Mitochondrial division protein 1 n=1 Tax=Dactylonectria estremocensis TaxID=1079267 RepID=A0A9P9E6Q5_9HYPO|nr:quinon protein alcohol dehydrogenase-like superfamily [Dactylonectria estremocensis]
MEAVGGASSIIAIVEISAKLAKVLFQYSQDVKNARKDIERLRKEVVNLQDTANTLDKLLRGPNRSKLRATEALRDALTNSEVRLKTLQDKLSTTSLRVKLQRFGFQALKWPFQSTEVENLINQFVKDRETISFALQMDQTTVLLDLEGNVHTIDQKNVLARLPVSKGAAFDSYAEAHNPICLENTRVELLQQIIQWAECRSSKSLFWLNGMAGMGKSTISRTIARRFDADGCLGASFFLKNGETDRSNLAKFCTTIAAQLVGKVPAIAPFIKEIIDADPSIFSKGMREQFQKLVIQPLSRVSARGQPLIVIIDALDECHDDEDARLLINLLPSFQDAVSAQVKAFITSRPELPIRLGFNSIGPIYQHLVLHEVSQMTVDHDLTAYLTHHIEIIRVEFNDSVTEDRKLSSDWPGQARTETLVKMASPLFIFAATMCRFIADRRFGNPGNQLREVLEFQETSRESQLDATYLPVLNQLFAGISGRRQELVLQRFKEIVGPIVTLANPLSKAALSRILGIQQQSIEDQLDMLHSVLSVPKSADVPVRLLHLSFRDFLVDPEKRKEHVFWIDEKQTHQQMIHHCLNTMKTSLKTNICDFKDPAVKQSSIDPEFLMSCLGPDVQYACLYWTHHAQEAGPGSLSDDILYEFMCTYFLNWVEALSLMGRGSECLEITRLLQSLVQTLEPLEFLKDAERFLLANMAIVYSTPLQIYSSALVFSPNRSIVRRTFNSEIVPWISIFPETYEHWDHRLHTLEGHKGRVMSVKFSPDSKLLASVSKDQTLCIWRVDNGKCLHRLEHPPTLGFSRKIHFSSNSKYVALFTSNAVFIWTVSNGELLWDRGTYDCIGAFSPNNSLIATSPMGKRVVLWSLETGELVQELSTVKDILRSITFSPDGAILFCVLGEELTIWQLDSGVCLKSWKPQGLPVAFANDSLYLAMTDSDKVQIWHLPTMQCIQELDTDDRNMGYIPEIAFSPNGSCLAWVSQRKATLHIWSTETWECLHSIPTQEEFCRWKLSFSQDSSHIATISGMSAQCWSVDSGHRMRNFDFPEYGVTAISPAQNLLAFSKENRILISDFALDGSTGDIEDFKLPFDTLLLSPDASTLAIMEMEDDDTVGLWKAEDVKFVRDLKIDDGTINVLAFNPTSTMLAAGGSKAIWIWRLDGGQCLHKLKGHFEDISHVMFAPNSRFLAARCFHQLRPSTRIWDVSNGHTIRQFHGSEHDLSSLTVFSSDSSLVAVGCGGYSAREAVVRLWKIGKGEPIRRLEGTGSVMIAVAFSSDSELLAALDIDGTIRMWQTRTGENLRDVQGPNHSWSTRAKFSADLSLIVTIDTKNIIFIRGVATGEVRSIPLEWPPVGRPLVQFEFDSSSENIVTDRGSFSIDGQNVTQPSRSGYGFSFDRDWIMWEDKRLLWLPGAFHPYCSAISGSTVYIGCEKGRLIKMKFAAEDLFK